MIRNNLGDIICNLESAIHIFLSLDVDSINENDSVANPDPTPRIASVHKSHSPRLCLWNAGWRLFTTVYYYVNGKTPRVHSRDVFYWAWITRTWRDAWTIYVTHVIDTRWIRARMQIRRRSVVLWLGKYWISRGRQGVTSWLWVGIKIWWTRVEVWLKNTWVSVANEFVFCQNLNESPSNLNLHELPWSNTFLPREIQYFPNHSTTHRLLLCMHARIDRVSITCVTYMVHASCHVRVIHAQ